MDARKKKLLMDMASYALGDFGARLVSFILVPFYTRYLSIAEYGTMDLINVTQSLIVPIICLQINSGVFRFLLGSSYDFKAIISTGAIFTAVTAAIGVIAACLIIGFFGISIKYLYLIMLMYIATLFYNLISQIIRGMDNIRLFSIGGIFLTALIGSMNVLFIGLMGMNYLGMVLATTIATVGVSVVLFFRAGINRYIRLQLINRKLLKELLVYSLPLLPSGLNWWLIHLSNRYLISSYLDVKALGIYSLASQFAGAVFIFNSIFDRAWQTNAVQEYNSAGKDAYFSEVFNYLIKLQVAVTLFATILLKYGIELLVGKTYSGALQYINVLLVANIFLSLSLFYGVAYNCSKKTKAAFYTTLAGAIINIAGNVILLPRLGLMGAPIALLAAYLLLWWSRAGTTQKYFKISADYGYLLKGLAIIGGYNIAAVTGIGNNLILDIAAIVCWLLLNNKQIIRVTRCCKP